MKAGLPVLVLLALGSLPARAAVTEIHYVMGSYLRITVDGMAEPAARAAMRRCFMRVQALDARFSRFRPDSELSQVNASADGPSAVSGDMRALLARALALRQATGGSFDPTIGRLTRLWRDAETWPSPAEWIAAQPPTGAAALVLTSGGLERRAGVQIDLDGIAKGWAVDDCTALLRAAGAGDALLNFGDSSWRVIGRAREIELRDSAGAYALGTVRLHDEALSVSSVYGHRHTIGGVPIGHIVDPHRGVALRRAATAVTIAPSATDAEAFSKAVLVDRGLRDRRHLVTGALLIDGGGIRRWRRVRWRGFAPPVRLPADAEPLQ